MAAGSHMVGTSPQGAATSSAAQTRPERDPRLTGLELLVSSLGHELNNPLSYVLANLDLALENMGAEPSELRTLLEEARDGARRIAEIVKTLQTLCPSEASFTPEELRRLLERSVEKNPVGCRELPSRPDAVLR